MKKVKAKKHLGQHFLKDETIAFRIANSISYKENIPVFEIGPGMGVLTKYILEKSNNIYLIEIDSESVNYLFENFNLEQNQIIEGDYLKLSTDFFPKKFNLIGNFPYNISSQILFKVIDLFPKVNEIVGMFQKEVAERVVSKEGNKIYGILSVIVQLYYETEYLFTVNENVFNPPPKVKSGVIRLKQKNSIPKIDEILFKKIVKTSFGQRRKMLRNSLKEWLNNDWVDQTKIEKFINLRPENLSVEDFVALTQILGDEKRI